MLQARIVVGLLALILICAGPAVEAAPTASTNPTATIDAGVLIGTTTAVPSGKASVNKFLGIPFAVSPPERFSPPQPVGEFPGPVTVQAVSPACVQEFMCQYHYSHQGIILTRSKDPAKSRNFTITVFDTPQPAESEDCLYLNVFAPATGETGKSVMFYIYGGALQFGDAGNPFYDGSSFAANQDVIVVSANYRTNGMYPLASCSKLLT